MTRVVGERVTLRAFREDEFERVLQAAQAAPVGDGIHWGPREPEPIRQKIEASGTWHDGWIEFAIEADGRVVGEIQARSIRRAMPQGVFELGVEIYDHADRRRGLGAEAVKEMTAYLFRDEAATGCRSRPTSTTPRCGRSPSGSASPSKGVQRGFMPSSAGPRDYAMYGVTRADHEQ